MYQRIKRAKNHQKAVVAVGRHLAEAAWWMLTKQEVYREPQGPQQSSFVDARTERSPEDFGGDGLPFLVIMDKSGHIRLVHDGYDRSEPLQPELAKEIEALLNEG